jgi:ribonuclease J
VSEIEKIKKLGDNQEILAMICDSTNAINEGHSRSEGELYDSLRSLIAGRKGLVGVATFASNIARVHTIAKIAKELGRKIVLAGYSLQRLYEVGKKSGFFLEDYGFISDREIKHYSKNEILVICTGCQGEEMAAVRKIALGNHNFINFTKNDLMIFSSKIIPGNEKKIFELFDLLAKKQIDVMTEKDHIVHVSGHPSRDELRQMYHLARPKISIPVHGEFIHTKAHCELALECGINRVIQAENGVAIRISRDLSATEIVGKVKSGYFGIDGNQLIDLKSEIIKERKKLQEAGIVIISIAVNDCLKIINRAKIITVGSYDLNRDEESEDFLRQEISLFFKNRAKELDLQDGSGLNFLKKKKKRLKIQESKILQDLEKQLRTKLLKIFEELMGKRPALEVLIHLVD